MTSSKPRFQNTKSTYGGPVLAYEPEVVAEEWQDADEKQRCHKEKEQYVEFGMRVGKMFLWRRTESQLLTLDSINTN